MSLTKKEKGKKKKEKLAITRGTALFLACASLNPVWAQERNTETLRGSQPGSPVPTAGPVGSPPGTVRGGAGSPGAAPKKPASGMDSGIATLPAASNHQNAMKAGPEVDVLFNLVIGRIVETRQKKNSTELVWLQRILSPALGFDGRYIRPLGAGFRAAAGGKGQLFFRSSGSQSASVGFTSSNSDKSGDKKFEFIWDLYAVSTWEKGPFRVHGGTQYGTSASWAGVLSDDLGPLNGSTGLTPFLGADIRVSSKGRRIRIELMAPLAFEKPPLAIFTKADNLFQFNLGWIKTISGYAVLGYFDQRFGVVPAQPKKKPGEADKEASPAMTPVPSVAATTPSPVPTAAHAIAVLDLEAEPGLSPSLAAGAGERLRASFVELGGFQVMSREAMGAAFQQAGFQPSGLPPDNAERVRAGQALKVPRLVAGKLSASASGFALSAHFVDIQTTQADNPVTETLRDGSPEVLREATLALARKLAAGLPPPRALEVAPATQGSTTAPPTESQTR